MNPIGYFSNNPPTSFLPRKGGGGITDSIPSPHRGGGLGWGDACPVEFGVR